MAHSLAFAPMPLRAAATPPQRPLTRSHRQPSSRLRYGAVAVCGQPMRSRHYIGADRVRPADRGGGGLHRGLARASDAGVLQPDERRVEGADRGEGQPVDCRRQGRGRPCLHALELADRCPVRPLFVQRPACNPGGLTWSRTGQRSRPRSTPRCAQSPISPSPTAIPPPSARAGQGRQRTHGDPPAGAPTYHTVYVVLDEQELRDINGTLIGHARQLQLKQRDKRFDGAIIKAIGTESRWLVPMLTG